MSSSHEHAPAGEPAADRVAGATREGNLLRVAATAATPQAGAQREPHAAPDEQHPAAADIPALAGAAVGSAAQRGAGAAAAAELSGVLSDVAHALRELRADLSTTLKATPSLPPAVVPESARGVGRTAHPLSLSPNAGEGLIMRGNRLFKELPPEFLREDCDMDKPVEARSHR